MKTTKSVLLVEDDIDDQLFFIEALSEISNATLFYIANNGKEALEKLSGSDCLPDLIFSDIDMPVMGGIECLREIKSNAQIKNIPVVMLTGSTSQVESARQFGARAFIGKSFDGKELRNRIEQMINLDFNMDDFIASQTFKNLNSRFIRSA